jgi:PIN domain nuclease of toxin-antitoxin system
VKLLLDTQCWLWCFAQPERLSEDAIAFASKYLNQLIIDDFSNILALDYSA